MKQQQCHGIKVKRYIREPTCGIKFIFSDNGRPMLCNNKAIEKRN